ncbi:MAG: transporter substrate-binding domain-containing protein [Kiritimatiellales bacterium]|nr:transporter substrate-binding domain-containing protein [Kiritimatiellales bacterium]
MRVFLISLFLVPMLGAAALDLSPAEKRFVAKHPVISTRYTNDSPPLEFVEQGAPAGFIVDYLRRIAGLAGLDMDFGDRPEAWGDIERSFSEREIDLLSGTVTADRYNDYALLTDPYLYFRRVYVVRKNEPEVRSPQDLRGRTVAATRGLPYVDVWKEKYPDIHFLMVETTEEVFLAVADGRADAAYTLKSTSDYFTARNALLNLRSDGVQDRDDGLENCFRIAVRSDWPELQTILNKAIAELPMADRDELWGKWLGERAASLEMEFTAVERAYIQTHPVLRYSILPDAPPLEFFDADGSPCGLTVEYVDQLETQTGIHFECLPSSSRDDKIKFLREGRCDFLASFSPHTSLGEEYLLTDTHMEFPLVVATRVDVPFINTLEDCAGQRVGMLSRLGSFHQFRQRFPDVEFVDVETIPDGLRELSRGRLFGVVAPQPVVGYYIQELYLGNLKITGTLEETLRLVAAVPPGHEPLVGILNKAFASIPHEEQRRMLNDWMNVRFEQGFDYRLFRKLMGGMVVILGLILIRYRYVAIHSRKLKKLNDELEESLEERDRIMSVISHDLRQPIHGYNQMLSLLQSGAVDPTVADGQRILTQSRQRGELAIESMENLLNWLNIHRRARHPVVLSPYRLVEDSRELLSASLDNKQLKLENQIDPNLRITADEQRLGAVLRNLINNAIKFSPPSSSIEVAAEMLEEGLKVIVRDYGTGMDEQIIRRLLDGGTVQSVRGTAGEKGSGMGLNLCRQFLKEVGAEIHIESSLGEGSTFSFVLLTHGN